MMKRKQLSGLKGTISVAKRPAPSLTTPSTPSLGLSISIEDQIKTILISSQTVSPEQADILISLKSTTGLPVLRLPENLLDIIDLLKSQGFDITLQYLTENRDLSPYGISFNSPLLIKSKEQAMIEAELLRNKPIETKSDEPCPRCYSDNVMVMHAQLRSADEGMSTLHQCLSCNKKW